MYRVPMKTNVITGNDGCKLTNGFMLLLIFSYWTPTYDAAHVVQSSRCTVEERKNHIQCFEVLPEEQYSAPLGSTVNMQCVVLNQHGKVQWRAKQVLLGYDRSVPSNSRYRIIGDVSRGEHTLQIMDIELQDAGEYECQVTPVPANNHPLLRRKTILVVLVKPAPPRILYPDVPPPDNQLIISQLDPIVRITVLCVALDGSPPPNFTWIHNGREIPISTPQTSTKRVVPKQGQWTSLAPIIQTQNERGESRISLLKAGLRDGDHLMCSVTNAATQLHHDVHQRNLTTAVTIRVHTPPGPPQIISPEPNREYIEGEELKAVCVASPPGNPFGGLFWRWLLQPSQVNDPTVGRISGLGGKGGARLGDYSSVENYLQTLDNTEQHGQRSEPYPVDLISEDVQPLHYTLSKEKDRLVNTLIFPRISRRYHASKLVCETGHPVGTAHHTTVNIQVRYPPTNVSISVEGGEVREEIVGGRKEYVVYGRAGETKTLVCRTSAYYKRAIIKWIAQSSDMDFTKPPRHLSGQTKTMPTPDGESWFQESRVNVKISEEDDRGYIDCRVWGEGDVRVDARVRLDIIYPPGVPIISGYSSMQPVKMAHSLELTCTTTGGNPPPELTWMRDRQPLTTSESTVVTGKQSSLKLKIVPQKQDNGAHYYCAARNAATDTTGVFSESVILNVIFPPQRVTINFHGPSVVPSGQPLVMNCQADTSNPVASITWWHFRCGPAHAFDKLQAISHEQVKLGSMDGSRGVSESAKCQSEQLEGNDETPIPGAAGGFHAHSRLWLRPTWHYHMDFIECRTENRDYGPPVWHDRLQLNVTFLPQFLGLQTGVEKVVKEGQTMKLDLGPYGNPPVTSVHWFVNGHQLLPDSTAADSPQGVYASGKLGGLLSLRAVSRDHMANYTIVASNSIGESRAVFFLNVTFPAGLLDSAEENVTKTTAKAARLSCRASANPAVAAHAFTWYRYQPPPGWPQDVNEADVQLGPPIKCNQTAAPLVDDKIFVQCKQDDLTRITSMLTVYRVNMDDVGTYVCEVNNGLGDPAQKRINLFHDFAPSIIRLPRYTKAAGVQGSTITLTCLIRTEPTPRVAWLKDKQVLSVASGSDSDENPRGEKYIFGFEHVRPGLYKSTLTLGGLQKSDFGTYYCQVVNMQGEAELEVHVSGTSTPDVPLNLRLLNSTSTSLHVAWTQGFDGGLTQTFQVRWKQADPQDMYRYADVAANDNHHAVDYLITGLQPGTEYLVSVNAKNSKHGASAHTEFIHVRTDTYDRPIGSPLLPPLSSAGPNDDNALLIIVAACVFGFVILVINLVVITFLVKRRRQRRRLQAERKYRTRCPTNITMTNGFTMVPQSASREMGEYRASGMEMRANPLNSTTADSTDQCFCCPQQKRSSNKSGYLKADSFENFAQANGHVTPFFGQSNLPTDMEQMGRFQRRPSQLMCEQEAVPDFGHISANKLAAGFSTGHTYQNSSPLDAGAYGMVNKSLADIRNSQQLLCSELTQNHLNVYETQAEPLLSQDLSRSASQTQYNQYTPRHISMHPRYTSISLTAPLVHSPLTNFADEDRRKMEVHSTLPRSTDYRQYFEVRSADSYRLPVLPFQDQKKQTDLPGVNVSLNESGTTEDLSRQILLSGLTAFSQSWGHGTSIENHHTALYVDASNDPRMEHSDSNFVSLNITDPYLPTVQVQNCLPGQMCTSPQNMCTEQSVDYTPLVVSLHPDQQLHFSNADALLMSNSLIRDSLYPASSMAFADNMSPTPVVVFPSVGNSLNACNSPTTYKTESTGA